jgi:hypothetical protein
MNACFAKNGIGTTKGSKFFGSFLKEREQELRHCHSISE